MAGSGKRRRLGVEMGVGSGSGWMPHLWIMAFPLDEQTDAAAQSCSLGPGFGQDVDGAWVG